MPQDLFVETRGVVLNVRRRRFVRHRHDAAEAGDLERELVEFALDPHEALRLDVVEAVQYEFAIAFEAKILASERPVFPTLPRPQIRKDHGLGLVFKLREIYLAKVDAIAREYRVGAASPTFAFSGV